MLGDILDELLRDNSLDDSSVSNEEVKVREVEKEFYILIENPIEKFKALGITESETHDQWEIKGQAERVRVRATTKNDQTTYEMTRKKDGYEYNEEITEFVFNCYKSMAPSGMVKERFNLPIPNEDAKFEFDLSYKEDGTFAPWCKVDIEIPENGFKHGFPKIPEIYEDIIKGSEKDVVTIILEENFIRKGNSALAQL